MAHVVHTPMMIMICRTADGLVIQRWMQYHSYCFDYEFYLDNNIYPESGLYATFGVLYNYLGDGFTTTLETLLEMQLEME